MFNLSAYLPDAVVPQYEALRDQLVSLLQILGLAQSKTDAAAGSYPRDWRVLCDTDTGPEDTSKAHKALNDAEHSLNLARREKEDKEKELSRLFDPEWYGPEGEWKKLSGTCIEKEAGE